jgi:hypothetical protein
MDEPYEHEYTTQEIAKQDRFFQNVSLESQPIEDTKRSLVNGKKIVEEKHPSWRDLRSQLVLEG